MAYNYIKSVSDSSSGGCKVSVEGYDLTLANLSKSEVELFDKELKPTMASILANRDVLNLFENNVAYLLQAMDVAKAQFQSKPFGGFNARSNEFGMTVIRPEHLGFSTWDGSNTALGWGNWIGTAAVPITISSSVFIAILGLVNYDASPKCSAVRMGVGNTQFPVWYFENNQRENTSVRLFELPKKIWLESEIQFYARKKRDVVGSDSLALMGLAFVEGPTLLLESPTPLSPTVLTVPIV
ncbi:MAG: hypothetical protein O8C67_05125 [Candidatus Methanoperedens sp.]|nr:hypothetical protein [Candidatus Methanoperedens sp.]